MTVYLTGAVLTAEDFYSTFIHNHKTYETTKGLMMDIYKANRKVRSSKALEAARLSTNLKILGVAGSGLMMAQSGSKMISGKAAPIDALDFTFGSAGFASGISEIAGKEIPYVGQAVALYSWSRFWLDLGYNHGPSTWFRSSQNSEVIEYMRKHGY
jgi:hypothetical protein